MMKFWKKNAIITILGIVLFGVLKIYIPWFDYVQLALILYLALICLPFLIYHYNEGKRKSIRK